MNQHYLFARLTILAAILFIGQVVRKQACRHTQAANVDRQMFAKEENK